MTMFRPKPCSWCKEVHVASRKISWHMIWMKLERGVSPYSWVKVFVELVSLGRGHCFLARMEKIVFEGTCLPAFDPKNP